MDDKNHVKGDVHTYWFVYGLSIDTSFWLCHCHLWLFLNNKMVIMTVLEVFCGEEQIDSRGIFKVL